MKKIIKRIPTFLVMVSFAVAALAATFVPNFEWAGNLVNIGTLINWIMILAFAVIFIGLIFQDHTMAGYKEDEKSKENVERMAIADKLTMWGLWPLLIQLIAFTIAGYGFAIFTVILAMLMDVISTAAFNAEREKAIATMKVVNQKKEDQAFNERLKNAFGQEVFTQADADKLMKRVRQ